MARTPWKNHVAAACVADVLPGSIAEEIGVLPGDVLLAVNGEPLSDFIAYRFAIAEEEIHLHIARGDDEFEAEIEKDADDDLGLVFTGDVFDGVRACRNNCVFCFEEQMPDGMRGSLRLRDDDFRLSFLHGNFLTLTNMRDADYQRIIREHLSPLFVSIHATDPVIRRRMLRNPRAPEILAQLRRLGEGGIQLHGQIVLCPGWNDGEVLARTIADLAALSPTILSLGVVPVGLTAHRPAGPEVRAVTPGDAVAVLATIHRFQQTLLPTLGTRFVFAADEWYLTAGLPLPSAPKYEAFEQEENGIGLARRFLDEAACLTDPGHLPIIDHVTLVTGMLAAPLLTAFAAQLRQWGAHVDVVAAQNGFYGAGVTVAGLLTGQDVLAALRDRDPGRAVLLPAVMRNSDGIFLDDMTPEALSAQLGVPVYFCHGPAEVLSQIWGM